MSNLYWCIAGIIGGAIFSFIISALFFFAGLQRKRMSYEVNTFCIVSNKIAKIEGLEVKYHSKEIDNLFASTITIKNIGNSIIESSDFSPSYPLSISTTGKFLIDTSNGMQLRSSNKANNIYPKFEVDDEYTCNRIFIVFDYIPKHEQLTCSFFHTGEIAVKGVLKDGKILNNYKNPNKTTLS